MFENIKWLRLTPDRPGRGGTKTGIHTFQQEPMNDIRSLTGGHVYQGSWRREFSTVTYPDPQSSPAIAGSFPFPVALHGYVYPSLTDPSATPTVSVFAQLQIAGALTEAIIWDVGNGSIRGPARGTTVGTPAVFQNIGGRCFIADGLTEGLILDDRTPAIHQQSNQNLGIGTPTQALSGAFPSGVTPYGTGYIYAGDSSVPNRSHYITHPNPDNMLGTILTTDVVSLSFPNPSIGQYNGVVIVQANPSSDAISSNVVPFAAPGTMSITSGTSLITLTGATWPANFAYCGLSINFNGYSYVISDHGPNFVCYDINGNLTALQNTRALILGVYDGPTLTNVAYTITGCQLLMPGAGSTATMVNTGVLGYSQTTNSNLVQVQILAVQTGGYWRNLGNISLGPSAADSASGGSIQYVTDAAMLANKRNLTSASNPFATTDIGQPIAVDGAGSAGSTLITTIAGLVSAGTVRLANVNSSGSAIAAANAWWGGNPSISDGVMDNNVTFDLTSASNPFVSGDVGQTIVVDGGAAGPTALITTIATFVNSGKVTLALKNTSGAAISGKLVWWRGISVDVHAGPTYAYAWYDPETGHMSNISPLYQVPRPTTIGNLTDFANMTPTFQIDPGFISYPSGIDATRFSHIMFFRTLSTPGSSTLYPIGSLMPFVGKVHPGAVSTRGSWSPSTYHGWMGLPNNYTPAPTASGQNIWYDFSSDSDLLLSGGFRAPQFTNEKPMVLLRGGATQPGYPYCMAYWDRRLWLVNTQDPDVIAYSCDDAQCPLGVPEESFPPTNFLRLPSVDGQVMGMRTVGDLLLITTQRWAYIIAGNNESNYRLMKISASMPGVGTYQMDEFPTYSGAEGEPSTLFYLGRDRIVYQWTVGGQVVPISQPIQNQLDDVLSGTNAANGFTQLLEYQQSRVHCVSAWGRRLVVVAPNAGSFNEVPSLGPSQVQIYDIDNRIWSESFHANAAGHVQDGLAPMTTIYGLDVPANELFAVFDYDTNSLVVRSWLRDDVTTATGVYMTLGTFPTNFDGKKTRKQIVAMNLHATAGSWTGGIFVNEATAAVAATFGPYPDPLYSIYAPVATPFDPGAQDIVVLGGQFTNPSHPIVGYRFGFVVQKNADSNPAQVYALDIGYVEYEETGDGDP